MKPTQIARLISEDTNFHGGIIAEEDIGEYDVFEVPMEVLADMVEENGGKASDLQLIIRKCFDEFVPNLHAIPMILGSMDGTTDIGSANARLCFNGIMTMLQHLATYDPNSDDVITYTLFMYNKVTEKSPDYVRYMLNDLSENLISMATTINTDLSYLHRHQIRYYSGRNVSGLINKIVSALCKFSNRVNDVIEYILPRIIDWDN